MWSTGHPISRIIRREYLGALHCPPGSDDTADVWRRAVRYRNVLVAAGGAAAPDRRAAIFVSASLPGASPEVMASTVATPLERHLGAISDVDDMTSTSSVGSTNIQLTFASTAISTVPPATCRRRSWRRMPTCRAL